MTILQRISRAVKQTCPAGGKLVPNVGRHAHGVRIGQSRPRLPGGELAVTTYLITRHAGAVAWLRRQGIDFEELSHLDNATAIKPGDHVIGPLPLSGIADIVAAGARYEAIEMDLPEGARGSELSADDMERYGARLVRYHVERIAVDAV
jgi:CRISPR-associated protein Csx16